ncbi:hypothetical protein HDU86_001275 [Geranomyces michiganensis]|nr:hypothetical protein HDU86_001275 [Geranomyces michiganensis]
MLTAEGHQQQEQQQQAPQKRLQKPEETLVSDERVSRANRRKLVAQQQQLSNSAVRNGRTTTSVPSEPRQKTPPPYDTAPAAQSPQPADTIPSTESPTASVRAAIRAVLFPCIVRESQVIAELQRRVRSPFVDSFFKYLGALGTHTAFFLLLPCLFWFDSGSTIVDFGQEVDKNRVYGRSLVLLLAAGVYFSGAAKDYIGLPRPLPPVVRMSTSVSIDVEYGFPSTHTANATSLSLFTALYFQRYWASSWSEPAQTAILLALATYSVLIGLSRIVTGMHTLLDVIGGAIIGCGIVLIHWYWLMAPMEEWLMNSWTVPLVMVPLCVLLISIHPDPEGPCPCFDDSVAFVGTCGGLMIGNWHYGIYIVSHPAVLRPLTALMTVQRLAFGISLIVAWRITTKRVCYALLPPLYRTLALPFKRKFFSLADKDYKSIPASHVSFAPSLLHLAATDKMRFRLPRYDVDIATKLIVYCGIGLLATDVIPVLFDVLNF